MSEDIQSISSHTRHDARRSQDETTRAFTLLQHPRLGGRLGLRFADGGRRAKSISYLHLKDMSYDEETGITLVTPDERITISGRNLWPLYLRLEEEVVCEIFERHDYYDLAYSDPPANESDEGKTYITNLLIDAK